MSTLPLRDYQREALDAIWAAEAADKTSRIAVVLPTGAGKTVLFAHLVKEWMRAYPVPVLILVHRDELIQQTVDKLSSLIPERLIGVVKGSQNDGEKRVVVASVQTASRPERLTQMHDDFGLIIIDECHHAAADSYMRVLDSFPDAFAVGFTATLSRGDDRSLGDVWEKVVYRRDILDMIRDGYLCDVQGRMVTLDGLSLEEVTVRGGDYAPRSLGEALLSADAPGLIVDAYALHATDRQGVVFLPDVATTLAVTEAFADRGFNVAAVLGSDNVDVRRKVLDDFRAGHVQVLVNCMVLCLDTETEILTDRGWTSYLEMTPEHRVANWDQGAVFFKEPYEVVVRDRGPSEDMYVLETPRRSIRVTGGHRMLYRTYTEGLYKKAPVEDLAGRKVALPTTGMAEPERPVDLTVDECALIGFWLGDGSANRPRSGGIEYTMSQAAVYPHIIRWVDDLIHRVGIDHRRYDKSHYQTPHIRWSLPRGTGGKSQQRNGVQRFEGYLDKQGSDLLWNLDKAQFDALLTGLWYADGNHGQAENGLPDSFWIYGCTLPFLEKVQAIASVRGWTCSLRRDTAPRKEGNRQLYRISLHRRSEHRMGGTDPRYRIQKEDAPWRPEKVWCVRTETRNIITRRRGSVTVMGNTEGFDAPSASCVVIARPTRSPALYVQMVGRVLRTFPGKVDALVLDVVGATADHRLATLVDLTSRRVQRVTEGESLAEAVKRERENGNPYLRDYAMGASDVNLFAASKSLWLRTYEGVHFIPLTDSVLFIWPGSGPDLYHVGWRPTRTGGGKWELKDVGLDLAVSFAESLAAAADDSTVSSRTASWRKRREDPSPAQVAKVRRIGLEVAEGATKRQVSDQISVHIVSRLLDAPLKGGKS
jgi:superfamily II DNA or RNA helicase